MKKGFLALITLLSFTCLEATPPQNTERLSSKIVLENTQGYYVLGDGSCWKVIGFSKRWRSLSEWWNGVELAPACYDCLPSDWMVGTQIEVYSKFENLNVKESDASNESDLKQCTHLLFNKRTGHVLFATYLDTADCITRLYEDAHKEGYEKGVHVGRQQGYKNSDEIFEKGRAKGYKEGFKAGFESAKDQMPGIDGHPPISSLDAYDDFWN